MASLEARLGAAGFATVTCRETPDARPEQATTVWVNLFASVERCSLGRALDLDKEATARHHNVHVSLGADVLDVGQIEDGRTIDDAN